MTPFRLQFEFPPPDHFTPAEKRVLFEHAGQRWQSIILGWPALSNGSAPTLPGGPALGYLRVKIIVDEVAGAKARVDPNSLLHIEAPGERVDRLPYEGTIRISSGDLSLMRAAPARFKDTVVHEIGHVLGLGIIYQDKKLVVRRGKELFFTGLHAMEAYAFLMTSQVGSLPVPLDTENEGTTMAFHWAEKALSMEIMSASLDIEHASRQPGQGSNAISKITVGALADLGYEVNMARAEFFRLFTPVDGETARALRSTPK